MNNDNNNKILCLIVIITVVIIWLFFSPVYDIQCSKAEDLCTLQKRTMLLGGPIVKSFHISDIDSYTIKSKINYKALQDFRDGRTHYRHNDRYIFYLSLKFKDGHVMDLPEIYSNVKPYSIDKYYNDIISKDNYKLVLHPSAVNDMHDRIIFRH